MSSAITPALFSFLRDLAADNSRPWFEANRARYAQDVKAPLLAFIAALQPELRRIAPAFIADPRPVGGSMFRLHRDTRFSRDKVPYKTHAAAHFRHRDNARDVHTPGFYLHLEPGACWIGAGIWRPDPPALRRLRRAVADDPGGWQARTAALEAGRFSRRGDSVKRLPAGFAATGWLADELRRTDQVWMAPISEVQVCGADFLDVFVAHCREAAPTVERIAEMLGLPTGA